MAERFLQYKNSSLHYETMGTGAKTLLMFHGFGQDHKAFQALSDTLIDVYTLYIFDIYFHGKSEWGYGESPLEKQHWKETVEAFLKERSIEKFSLAGFSLGGKFVLAILESFPEKLEAVFLLAPDGIKTSFWYSLATYPILFRRIFKSMVHHHGRFVAITRILHTLGLMDKGLLRFAEHQMNTEEKRRRVYYSWVVFRRLRFSMKAIASLINKNAIPLTLITGKYDKVIKPENMNRLLSRLTTYRLEIVDSGHNGLIAESVKHLKTNSP